MELDGKARFVAKPKHARRIVTGRARTFTGYVPSKKEGNDYRLIGYESLLERDFIQLMEDDRSIVSYQDQAEPFRWTDGDEWHVYWPDFVYVTDTGRSVCVEVKPLRKFRSQDLRIAFELIREAAVATGRFEEFQIWTDREIRSGSRLPNAEMLNGERGRANPIDQTLALRQVLKERGGRATVSVLRRESGLGERGFRAVLALLASGECRLERPCSLVGDASVVVWKAARP